MDNRIYELNRRSVIENVEKRLIGNYWLGSPQGRRGIPHEVRGEVHNGTTRTRNSRAAESVSWTGRAREGTATSASGPPRSIPEIFNIECREFHLLSGPVDNIRHPDSPRALGCVCQYCDRSGRRHHGRSWPTAMPMRHPRRVDFTGFLDGALDLGLSLDDGVKALDNAVDSGARTINVRLVKLEDDRIRVIVMDDGPGIPLVFEDESGEQKYGIPYVMAFGNSENPVPEVIADGAGRLIGRVRIRPLEDNHLPRAEGRQGRGLDQEGRRQRVEDVLLRIR